MSRHDFKGTDGRDYTVGFDHALGYFLQAWKTPEELKEEPEPNDPYGSKDLLWEIDMGPFQPCLVKIGSEFVPVKGNRSRILELLEKIIDKTDPQQISWTFMMAMDLPF